MNNEEKKEEYMKQMEELYSTRLYMVGDIDHSIEEKDNKKEIDLNYDAVIITNGEDGAQMGISSSNKFILEMATNYTGKIDEDRLAILHFDNSSLNIDLAGKSIIVHADDKFLKLDIINMEPKMLNILRGLDMIQYPYIGFKMNPSYIAGQPISIDFTYCDHIGDFTRSLGTLYSNDMGEAFSLLYKTYTTLTKRIRDIHSMVNLEPNEKLLIVSTSGLSHIKNINGNLLKEHYLVIDGEIKSELFPLSILDELQKSDAIIVDPSRYGVIYYNGLFVDPNDMRKKVESDIEKPNISLLLSMADNISAIEAGEEITNKELLLNKYNSKIKGTMYERRLLICTNGMVIDTEGICSFCKTLFNENVDEPDTEVGEDEYNTVEHETDEE